jgi:SagB-type dehydrogenase family enzyme
MARSAARRPALPSAAPRSRSKPQYRRVADLVAYWDTDGLVLRNYVSGVPVGATPLVFDVLDRLSEWQGIDRIRAAFPAWPPDALDSLVEALTESRLIERRGGAAASTAPDGNWRGWTPAAAFFHFATRDTPFARRHDTAQLLRKKAAVEPPPPPLKRPHKKARTVPLPPVTAQGELPAILRARRTWRRFGPEPVALADIATLLGLTWGVQHWLEIPPFGRMALKTAPSGGARHSVEVYLLARAVGGLARGIYHYDPDAHVLRRVRRGLTEADIESYLPHQEFYRDASAFFVMTSVFARVQWRYAFSRAYRTVLAEVGHHCQNLLLTATSLGLAPFCTMALADSTIERDLRVDGRHEAVLYLAGVGQRPEGEAWAPRPAGESTPRRTRPAWALTDDAPAGGRSAETRRSNVRTRPQNLPPSTPR